MESLETAFTSPVFAKISVVEVNEEELTRAENELRERARRLVLSIDNAYWELAQVLYDVYDGVPGGYRALMSGGGARSVRRELFRKWGYANFGEYCEKEIGLRERSAQNLRYVYYWFGIKLEVPAQMLADLKTLGRSKLYILAGVATQESLPLWVKMAKEMTFEKLKKEIDLAKKAMSESGGKGDGSDLPKPEQLHPVSTSLYDSQHETWVAALDRAKALSGSEKVGHNLELICQDFLSNNDLKAKSKEDLPTYLAKLERMLGITLIAIDPKSGRPLYRSSLLEQMIEEGKAA